MRHREFQRTDILAVTRSLASEQGWVARELARCGAQVTGLDLAPNLLALARHYEEQEPLGIGYVQGELCPGFAANAHVVAA